MAKQHELKDDPAIPDSEHLYRGIAAPQIHPDGTRPSSTAFIINRKDPHVSVDRASLCTPEDTLTGLEKSIAVAQLQARSARAVTIGVASDPLPQNPAHALIIRDLSLTKPEWKRRARKLAKACTWVIAPA